MEDLDDSEDEEFVEMIMMIMTVLDLRSHFRKFQACRTKTKCCSSLSTRRAKEKRHEACAKTKTNRTIL